MLCRPYIPAVDMKTSPTGEIANLVIVVGRVSSVGTVTTVAAITRGFWIHRAHRSAEDDRLPGERVWQCILR